LDIAGCHRGALRLAVALAGGRLIGDHGDIGRRAEQLLRAERYVLPARLFRHGARQSLVVKHVDRARKRHEALFVGVEPVELGVALPKPFLKVEQAFLQRGHGVPPDEFAGRNAGAPGWLPPEAEKLSRPPARPWAAALRTTA